MEQPDPVARLERMLMDAKIPYAALSEGNGFSISASNSARELKPILLAEESTVWLLVALEGEGHKLTLESTIAAREAANQINSEIPFGAFYVERGSVFFRNTIRWQTLAEHSQLSIFLFTTLSMIDQNAKYFRSATS